MIGKQLQAFGNNLSLSKKIEKNHLQSTTFASILSCGHLAGRCHTLLPLQVQTFVGIFTGFILFVMQLLVVAPVSAAPVLWTSDDSCQISLISPSGFKVGAATGAVSDMAKNAGNDLGNGPMQNSPPEAWAQKVVPATGALAQIEELNRQIVLNEILLEKHAINFRRFNNVQGRWKGWRYFLTQEGNNVATASGLVVVLTERYRIVRHPYVLEAEKISTTNKLTGKTTSKEEIVGLTNRARRSVLETGLYPQIVGQSLGAAGSAVELGINLYHEHQCRKLGYGPNASLKTVKSYEDTINSLFAKRDSLLLQGHLPDIDIAVALAEEKVLRDTTYMAVREYQDFQVNATRFKSFQDSIYLLDVAKNSVGAAGNIVGLVSNHEGSPYLNGPAGVLTTISGALVTVAPVAARGFGKMAGAIHRHKLKREMEVCAPCDLNKYDLDRKHLQTMINHKQVLGEMVSEKAAALLAAYEGNEKQEKTEYQLAQRELRAGTKAAQENVIVGGIVGTAKIAQGVCTLFAGYGLTTANHRANDMIIGGTIPYMSAIWLSAADNIRIRIVDECKRAKNSKAGLLPGQVLASRLNKLNDLENNLKLMQ